MSDGPRRAPREATLLALLTIALTTVLTYTARHTLNPDGVSYLDLAGLLPRGEWGSFVQGYWSPAYPALLGGLSALTGRTGAALIPVSHLLNLLCVAIAVAVIWAWSRRAANPLFGRAALAALLLCSAGPPRVEAVTPDLLLLAVLTGLAYALVAQGGTRWLVVGLLLGGAFLVKTSSWPWLLLTVVFRFGAAVDGAGRRNAVRSSLVAAAVMLIWVVPMSRKYQRITLGSTGRLNFCWYLEQCDSRTPDSHLGVHLKYREAELSGGGAITWVAFDQPAGWTYEPWSDPTEWDRGVMTRAKAPMTAGRLVPYWLRLTGLVFGVWLLPLTLGVLLPMGWACARPGMWRQLALAQRDSLVVMVLALIGLGQFIAVHAEPRLIGPFALLGSLGALAWLCAEPRPAGSSGLPKRSAGMLGILAGLGFIIARIPDGVTSDLRVTETSQALDAVMVRFRERGIGTRRIAIVGQAMPATAAAYWVGSQIVAQIPPRSIGAFARLPAAEQQRLLDTLLTGRADLAWVATPGGGAQLLPIRQVPVR